MKPGEDYPFVDGGIAVNNPALIGIAHAMLCPYKEKHPNQPNQVQLNDIAILSIGTGRPKQPYSYQEVKGWGMFGWAKHLGDIFLPAPNDVNANVCWQIIRGGDDENAKRVLRLDPKLEKDKELEAIDNPHLYDKFVEIAESYLSKTKIPVDMNLELTPKDAIKRFIENNPITLPVGVN
jgi:patatin-like phospholipase/acyl hydrolase